MRVKQLKRIVQNILNVQTSKIGVHKTILVNVSGRLFFTSFSSQGYYLDEMICDCPDPFTIEVDSSLLSSVASSLDSDVFSIKVFGSDLFFHGDLSYSLPFKACKGHSVSLKLLESIACSHVSFFKILSKFSFCCSSRSPGKVSGINFIPAEEGTKIISTDKFRVAHGSTDSFKVGTSFILTEEDIKRVTSIFDTFSGFELMHSGEGHLFFKIASVTTTLVFRVFKPAKPLIHFPTPKEMVYFDLEADKLKKILIQIVKFSSKKPIIPVMFKFTGDKMNISSEGVTGSLPLLSRDDSSIPETPFFVNAKFLLDFMETYEKFHCFLGVYFKSDNPLVIIHENLNVLNRSYLLMPLNMDKPTWEAK